MPRAGLQLSLERNISPNWRQTHGQTVYRASYWLSCPLGLGRQASLCLGGDAGVEEHAGLAIRERTPPARTALGGGSRGGRGCRQLIENEK